MAVVALVIFSNSVSYARMSWKREYKHGDILIAFVCCSSSPATPSLGERKLLSLVPCPDGPRVVCGSFPRQSRILHGSSPSAFLIMSNHSANTQHPALTPDTSVPSSSTQAFRMQRYFKHLVQVVCVSRTSDLENRFLLIALCSVVLERLTTRAEVKNDVIIIKPLISTVTVLFQVENSNSS